MNLDKFNEIVGWYGICKPRITEKTEAQLQFDFVITEVSILEEPGAVVSYPGICAGMTG